ncbi:MAG: hypothetical protein DDT40_01379 [candidate division WS2 bacterium]|nr:hypothetical protein [Candidatus Psychracetigena formicireducens]
MLMKRRIRFRFFVILFGISGIIAYMYFFLLSTAEAEYAFVERGEIVMRAQGDALVVREERIYDLPKHGRAEFSVTEGEWLEEGEPLAVLFASGYDEQLLYELRELQEHIFVYQRENLVNYILDSDVLGLQSAINESILDIQLFVRDSKQSYLGSKERDLRRLLTERQEILDKTASPDQYLKDLYEQEAEIKRQLSQSMIEVKAPASGIVSFSSDGLEDVLNPEAVNYIAIEDVSALIGQRRVLVDQQSVDRIPFVRLIEPDKWLVACIIINSNIFFNAGDEIELRFLDNYDVFYSGRVYKILKSNEASLVVIELTDKVQAVVSIRTSKVELSKKISGLMVSISALIEQNGVEGLKVVQGNSSLFAAVEVLAFGDKYAIIEDVVDDTNVDLNTKVILE